MFTISCSIGWSQSQFTGTIVTTFRLSVHYSFFSGSAVLRDGVPLWWLCFFVFAIAPVKPTLLPTIDSSRFGWWMPRHKMYAFTGTFFFAYFVDLVNYGVSYRPNARWRWTQHEDKRSIGREHTRKSYNFLLNNIPESCPVSRMYKISL